MNKTIATFLVSSLISATACWQRGSTSPEFTEAHQRFAKLYGAKLDDAFMLGEMTQVEELLRQVTADSLDYPNAQALLQRIREGRSAQAATDASRKRVLEELRRAPVEPKPVVAASKAVPPTPSATAAQEARSSPELATQVAGETNRSEERTTEPHPFSSRAETISYDTAARQVKASASASTLLFIYASWCPACRGTFPQVNTLARDSQAREVSVVALSIDESPEALEKYLKNQTMYFPALRVASSKGGELGEMIGQLGGHYPNAIPYLALFDATGILKTESGRGMSSSGIIALAKAQKKRR